MMALIALETTGVKFFVQGAHFKTYDSEAGWPVPEFLKKDEVAMCAFLGETAFGIYQKDPKKYLGLIKSKKLQSKAFSKTDMVSSGEDDEGRTMRRIERRVNGRSRVVPVAPAGDGKRDRGSRGTL